MYLLRRPKHLVRPRCAPWQRARLVQPGLESPGGRNQIGIPNRGLPHRGVVQTSMIGAWAEAADMAAALDALDQSRAPGARC